MTTPGRALNLPALARSAAGEPIDVPGSPFRVQQLLVPCDSSGNAARWVMVMSGEVIVDLEAGEFRVLRPGDALDLPAGTTATLRSVATPAMLLWHQAR
ncbi:MAG: cupin domain-containing protein [Trueperaceae bacterium]|nr:cupin domain-containing protein [Truepera sp.]HRQ09487.1 cupin domain-containing protein [Trueperaceae bacterium]